MVVLFSALTGMMVGSLGTVVIFWLCGALQRKTVTETVTDKVNPELRDATIQAEDTQATSTAPDETSDFRQMSRTQTSFSYYLYIGMEQLKQVIISIVVANFIRMWTTRREDCSFAKFAVPRHQFFKLDRASMCQSRGRDTTCLVSAGHSKVYRSLNIPDVGFVVHWNTPHGCYLEIRYLTAE